MAFYNKLDSILEGFEKESKPVVIASQLITKYPHSFKVLKYDLKAYTNQIQSIAQAEKEGKIQPKSLTPEGYVYVTYPGTAHSLASIIGLIGKPSGVKETAHLKDDYIVMTVHDEVVSVYEKIFKDFGIEYSKDFQSRYDVGGKGTKGKVSDTQFRLFFAENPAPMVAGDSPAFKKSQKPQEAKKQATAADARKRLADLKAKLAAKSNPNITSI